MTHSAGKILKSSDVEVEGRLHLDFGHPAHPAQASKNTAGQAAKVRMLENQLQYAVMEITCPCGRKTVIRCDYGESASVKNPQSKPEAALPKKQ